MNKREEFNGQSSSGPAQKRCPVHFSQSAAFFGSRPRSTSFTNFFLHIQPVRVSKRGFKAQLDNGAGVDQPVSVCILAVTGVLLMFYYVPSTTQAYDRMLDLRSSVAFGVISAQYAPLGGARNGPVFLHMSECSLPVLTKHRASSTGSSRCAFLFTLFLSYTGYLLPWDQLAFWAITVGTSIAGYAPVYRPSLLLPAAGPIPHGGTGSAAPPPPGGCCGSVCFMCLFGRHLISGASAKMVDWPSPN